MWGNPGSKHCQMAHISKKFTVKCLWGNFQWKRKPENLNHISLKISHKKFLHRWNRDDPCFEPSCNCKSIHL